ncbi:MAG: S46 family peptidase [Pyrinomonadaceae bacterium]
MSDRLARAAVLVFTAIIFVSFAQLPAFGDEGMFLPDTLSQLPLKKLTQRGLKIPVTDIYNPNGISMKDAVVIVDGGTGEFLSPEGLLLTNHHVAFEALVNASDQTKDYATNGYMARNRAEELPAKNYTVSITQDIKDVTVEVLSGISDTAPAAERTAAIQNKIRAMQTAAARPPDGITAQVLPLNEGLSYYMFTYLVLRDVRIVYSPPKSIGFFGGDPDNFEWPRHCGDFTFLRAYVGQDGKPAAYSQSNVPFKPKKFLSISMGGVKDGDFMMVLGYPGSTRRYRESYSVAYNQDVALPFSIDIFRKEIEALENAGKNDPVLHMRLQSTIFDIANTLKDEEGSVLAMRRADIVGRKRTQEGEFTRWLETDPARNTKYGEILPSLAKAYQELNSTATRDLLVPQLLQASDLLGIAFSAQDIAVAKEKPGADSDPAVATAVARARDRATAALAERNPAIERELLTYLLQKAAALPAGQKIEAVEKRFAGLQGDARRKAEEDFARSIVDSKSATPEAVARLFDLSSVQLRELHEPFVDFAAELLPLVSQQRIRTQAFNATVARWRPLMVRGMSEMHGTKPYPDANRTLRFTYGEVRGYVPHDAAIYLSSTTLAGVVEKDTGREPFDVPEKLKQLYRARDFGPYATPDGTNVPVDFLSTTDIIGGNSGSPIMNGRGEQVGIVFDGNYEGLGNDFFYNEDKGRTISVDIRYVLFLTDKFGGAGYILKELDLKNAPAALRRAA